jgi:hypothetical protein
MNRIIIIGSDYLAPEWTPLEILIGRYTNLLEHAMYLGELETTRGVAHGYKHDTSRRTIYILGGIPTKYKSVTQDDAELVPFDCISDALIWWQS